jgi:N utilization substance protein B
MNDAGPAAAARPERRASRLAAVQALYQMELTGQDAATVAQEFLDHRLVPEMESEETGTPDESLFRSIVAGVAHRQIEIDRAITDCLSENWRLQRIDSILRAILRASAFELVGRPDIPARVVIDEYIEVARRFCASEECAFVNAVLDRMAHADRAEEFAKAAAGDESGS